MFGQHSAPKKWSFKFLNKCITLPCITRLYFLGSFRSNLQPCPSFLVLILDACLPKTGLKFHRHLPICQSPGCCLPAEFLDLSPRKQILVLVLSGWNIRWNIFSQYFRLENNTVLLPEYELVVHSLKEMQSDWNCYPLFFKWVDFSISSKPRAITHIFVQPPENVAQFTYWQWSLWDNRVSLVSLRP